jgi:hypothetical protein
MLGTAQPTLAGKVTSKLAAVVANVGRARGVKEALYVSFVSGSGVVLQDDVTPRVSLFRV